MSSDHTTDATLGDTETQLPPAFARPDVEETIAAILDLETVLSSARLVERTATICIRGDLEDVAEQLYGELMTLIDENGQIVASDEALFEQKGARAQEIQDLLETNRAERAAASFRVRFQAMPSDEFETFERAHRTDGSRGKGTGLPKDDRKYVTDLIARCAIEPKLTPDEVEKLRAKLSAPQINALFNAAHAACTTGGLDVPKSLPFSLDLKPQE